MHLPDVVFFVAEDWGRFSQRGQSLALEFAARGHRVIYMQPILSLGALLRGLWRNSETAKVVATPEIIILKPILSLLSFRGGETWWIDKYLYRLWFKCMKHRHKIRDDAVVIVNLPYWWKWAVKKSDFPSGTFIYDCIDDIKVYARNEKVENKMRALEVKLVNECDVVLTTALALQQHILGINSTKRVEMITNGVDANKFMNKAGCDSVPFAGVARPVFGFVGALYYWIDLKVFEVLSESFPESTVVLVGPTNREEEISALCTMHQNIKYLGPIDYCDVPGYMAAFDVCLNPFIVDRLGDSVNPLKLYEYLAMGKPVVCSSTEEFRQFSEYAYLYSNYEELNKMVQLALTEDCHGLAVARRKFALQNAWSTKVESILDVIEKSVVSG
jgi:glycosyltransferase involved in cell wall biosynthesis